MAAASPDNPIDLFELGAALHPLQDSWSHQGVPDVPFGLRPNLGFGHPTARGGWKRHDADYTHLHPADAVVAAEKTYEVFELYLKRRPNDRLNKGASWASLRDAVQAFAVAASRDAKDAWASKHMTDKSVHQVAVNLLSLPPGGGQLPAGFEFKVASMPPPSYGLGNIPQVDAATLASVTNSAQRFLDAWFLNQDVSTAAAFFDREAITAQLRAIVAPAEPPPADEWVRRFLVSQLILDHAAVNAAGHADPTDPRWADIPAIVQRDGPLRVGNPIKVAIDHEAFVRVPPGAAGASQQFMMTLLGTHSAHDAIAVVWERRVGDEWRIVQAIIALTACGYTHCA